MKTKLFFALALAVVSVSAASALDWTLQNRFGGNSDMIAEEDFITFERGDGGRYGTDGVKPSDRLNFDFSSEKLSGRVRVHYQSDVNNGKFGYYGGDADVSQLASGLRFRGYAQFNPIKYVGVAAGSDYWDKYRLAASYLFATEDSRTDGRMANSGFSVIGDVMGIKVVANWAATSVDDFASYKDADLNFGIDYDAFGLFTIGATFKDVLDDFSASVYAGLTMIDNLDLNLGFHYNAGGTDYLQSSDYGTDTNGTEMMLSLSAGYKFGFGLGIYADFATGFNDKYVDSSFTSISRGTDEIPMYVVGRLSYDLGDNLVFGFQAKFFVMAMAEDALEEMILYPNVSYSLAQFGNIRTGVRFHVADGVLDKFSIPVMWEYRISSSK